MRELGDGLRLLGPADYRRMRWKNGRGWTTEIAVSPADAGLDGKPFDWRISMAEIEQDGEFSAFAGYDRTILVAEGAGTELTFDATPPLRLAERYRPVRFRGEWHTRCHLLDGPVRDFNIMTARARWQHHCRIARGAGLKLADAPAIDMLIVHCLRGGAKLGNYTGLQLALQAGETLLCSDTAIPQPFETVMADTESVLVNVSLKQMTPA